MTDYLRRQPGPEMTAGNMRAQGVRNLSVRCRVCNREKLWSMTDLAEMVEATLPPPGKRGLYKTQAQPAQ